MQCKVVVLPIETYCLFDVLVAVAVVVCLNSLLIACDHRAGL